MLQLHTLHFGGKPAYTRMLRVLKYSAAKNSPKTSLSVYYAPPMSKEFKSRTKGIHEVYRENVYKTQLHEELVHGAPDSALLGLLDCDLMVLKDLSPIESMDFDLAYTTRMKCSRYPFNTGVLFVRVSEKTREWFSSWHQNVLKLVRSPNLLRKYQTTFGRINQCGLGMTMERKHNLLLLGLPCSVWNAVSTDWSSINDMTRIVHIIEPLRKHALGNAGSPIGMDKAIKLWRKLEMEAQHER